MTVNNVNADEADDLRRALPAAITDFYQATQNNPLRIAIDEHDLHPVDFTLGQFQFIPIIVLVINISGILYTGLMTCQEWQTGTIKELLLAPAHRWIIVVAKLISGWGVTMLLAALVIAAGAVAGFMRVPEGGVLPCLLVIALLCLASAAIGNAMGMAFKHIGMVQGTGIQIALVLFFLSGGMSVIGFLPELVQRIAPFVPTYYAVHALDREILYNSNASVGTDIAVLCGFTAILIGITIAVFRRRTL
jgi:ABC-type multidrug transport system permease subunit